MNNQFSLINEKELMDTQGGYREKEKQNQLKIA